MVDRVYVIMSEEDTGPRSLRTVCYLRADAEALVKAERDSGGQELTIVEFRRYIKYDRDNQKFIEKIEKHGEV